MSSPLLTKPIITPAHSQQVTNRYHIAYRDHAPRESDPYYAAFTVYRAAHIADAVCYTGVRVGFDECADAQGKPIPTQPNGGHGLSSTTTSWSSLS